MKAIRSYPIIGAVIAQVAAALMVIAVSAALGGQTRLDPQKLFWLGLAVQSVVAALVTRLLGLPVWWVWIGLCFPVALALALNAGEMPAWPFGVGFVVLYLFFSNTARERVPLYLTNRLTTGGPAVADASTRRPALHRSRFGSRRCRTGAGRGGAACDVAWNPAPMVWLVSAVLSKIQRRGQIVRRDIWSTDLSGAGHRLCLPVARTDAAAVRQGETRNETRKPACLEQFRGTRCRGVGDLGARRSAQDPIVSLRDEPGGRRRDGWSGKGPRVDFSRARHTRFGKSFQGPTEGLPD
jgi:hypothetical protein